MKRFSLLLLLLLPVLLSAQQLTFRLVDAKSAAPIRDLVGVSSLQDITRFSNEKGLISFPLPRDSRGASFSFSGLGYQTLTYQVAAELPSEIITLEIQPQAFTLGLHVNNLFNTRWKETQFNTERRLFDEAESVEGIHFTPGSPFFARFSFSYSF